MQQYTVKTAQFEGPFDLLLELVRKRKLFINDIALCNVTDEYLAYIGNTNQRSIGSLTSFLVIAATLILLKSKSLLPTLSLSDDEQNEIDDLEMRLKLYQCFQEAGEYIAERFNQQPLYRRREERADEVIFFLPDKILTVSTLRDDITALLETLAPLERTEPEVSITRTIAIEDVIEHITNRVTKEVEISFSTLTNEFTTQEDRINIIVSFLAMLELVRSGMMDAIQAEHDIILTGTNSYD